MTDIFVEEQLQEEANRRALLLAQSRFNSEIRDFISGKPERMAYVKADLDQIIIESATEAGADPNYVADRFMVYVAESYDHPAVAVSEPEHMDIDSGSNEEGVPPKKNDPLKKNPEPDAETSVLDHGTVLEEEILEPDARIDLNENTIKSHCFRCDAELNEVVAAVTTVCPDCTKKLGDSLAPLGPSPVGQGNISPANPNTQVQCNFCAAKGYHFEGSQDQVQQHILQQHQAELQQQHQQMLTQPAPGTTAKVAGPEDNSPPTPDSQNDTVKVDEGVSDKANPVHHFDDAVQSMADKAAAIQFSAPDDEDVQNIASQYGLDPEEIKKNLYVTATFGDFTGANGHLTDKDTQVPDGYSEVSLEGMGGQVTHNALVPVDLAIDKVSQDLQMKPDLVRNMLADSYGDNLGDDYHASVSGDHRYYLPSALVDQGEEKQQKQQDQQQKVGPTPQPAAPVASINSLMEKDRRQLIASRRRYR